MSAQENKRKPTAARTTFLVASPFASDTPYQRSVVLVIRSDRQGSMGILVDSEFRKSMRQLRKRIGSLGETSVEKLEQDMKLQIVNWEPGGLLSELQQGIWMLTSAKQSDLARSDDLWVDLVRRVGRSVLKDSLGIQRFPVDPSRN